MLPFLATEHGNPASTTHDWGLRARQAVEEARAEVAALLGADPAEIVFTAGATESNNLALKGAARALARHGRGRHLVTTAMEHKSVLATVEALTLEGFSHTVVLPDDGGRVRPEHIEDSLRDDTVIVSVIAADGEMGVLQPLADIASRLHGRGILFHTDATQAIGKIPVSVQNPRLDLLSLSAHKFYGPKGAGALFVREGVVLEPLLSGGGQERGLRSGTLNVPAIVGLGMAARLRRDHMGEEAAHLRTLATRLWTGIHTRVPDAVLNGPVDDRLPGNLNIAFPRLPAESLLLALPDFALSTGSACRSGERGGSTVLAAVGVPAELAACAVRFGLGLGTTIEDVDHLIDALGRAVRRLRPPSVARTIKT